MTGFEPATPTLARLCATNCATSARYGRDRRPLRSTTIVHPSAATQIPAGPAVDRRQTVDARNGVAAGHPVDGELSRPRASVPAESPPPGGDDGRGHPCLQSRACRCRSVATCRFRDEARHVLIFLLVPLVPWLSGRASASHAEGRWFDPSRDHLVKGQCRAHIYGARSIEVRNSPALNRAQSRAPPLCVNGAGVGWKPLRWSRLRSWRRCPRDRLALAGGAGILGSGRRHTVMRVATAPTLDIKRYSLTRIATLSVKGSLRAEADYPWLEVISSDWGCLIRRFGCRFRC
jgi:hypothetical protein